MAISSESCLGQYRDDDHREDTSHFNLRKVKSRTKLKLGRPFRRTTTSRTVRRTGLMFVVRPIYWTCCRFCFKFIENRIWNDSRNTFDRFKIRNWFRYIGLTANLIDFWLVDIIDQWRVIWISFGMNNFKFTIKNRNLVLWKGWNLGIWRTKTITWCVMGFVIGHVTFYTVKGFLANQTIESILDFFLWRCRRYSTLKIIFEIEFLGEGSVMAKLGLRQVKGEFRPVVTFLEFSLVLEYIHRLLTALIFSVLYFGRYLRAQTLHFGGR